MKFELYKDNKNEWRWRLVSSNGNIIAISSEGYKNKTDARNSIVLTQMTDRNTEIIEK